MSLYQEIRPATFKDIVGNSAVVGSFMAMLRQPADHQPHAILLKGPTGCGKTTIARILAKEFGALSESVREINAANTSGIATVRDIAENAPMVGFGGGPKVYIFDECFLGKTRVLVDYDKSLPIKDIVELEGITEVLSYDIENKKIVKKKIVRKIKNSLVDRMCKIFISDKGRIHQIDSTRTHKFYVLGKGYIEAEKLKPGDKFIKYGGQFTNFYRCDRCDMIFKSGEELTYHKLSYHSSWKGTNLHKNGKCKYCGKSFKFVKAHQYWAHEVGKDELKAIRVRQIEGWEKFLGTDAGVEFCKDISKRQMGEKNTLYRHGGQGLKKLVAYNKRRWAKLSDIEKEAQIQRFMAAPRYRNSPNNPEKCIISMGIKDLEYTGDGSFFIPIVLNGKKRRKNPDFTVRREVGKNGVVSAEKFVEVMDLEYWHKDDWEDIQKAYQEAGFEILILDAKRVIDDVVNVKAELEAFVNNCYVEVVEPPLSKSGRKKNSCVNFKSKGVEFVYNLEIEDTHNYFVLAPPDDSVLINRYNDKNCLPILVSNCHEFTGKAQECLLKVIEDNPPHCYFIFCTTDSESLISTLRNRCDPYTVSLLQNEEIREVLIQACKKKEWAVSPDVIEALVQTSDGSPRAVLVALEKVAKMTNLDEAIELIINGTEKEKNIFDLFNLISMGPAARRKKWKTIITTFDSINEDSERIRFSLMTFLYNKLKKYDNVEDALDVTHLLKIFSNSTFYGKKSLMGALIARACFETWKD